MSSMINLKSTKKTPSITVGVNPITNINVSTANSSTENISTTNSTIEHSKSVDVEKEQLLREIQVYKLIIDIMHSNPLVVNKYIIADDELLIEIIRLLCNASDVQLDADDLGSGCLSKNNYRKVNSIYVVVNGETLNLKYDFPAVMKTLKDLHISVKYVF
jgi:hypothetical protein